MNKASIRTQVRARTGTDSGVFFFLLSKSVLDRAIIKPELVTFGDSLSGDVHTLGFCVDVFNEVIASGTDIILGKVLPINAVALTLTSFPLYN